MHAWYLKRLRDAIDDMHKSLTYWLKARYKSVGLAHDAADGTPVQQLRDELRELTGRWQESFDEMAKALSAEFAERVRSNSDASLAGELRKRDLSVKFTMSPEMRNAYQAVIGEQVGLIKSIASEHLSGVEGIVMRAVSEGRNLGELSRSLQKKYGVTKRRAAFIARDQSNKATTSMQVARQQHLGITEGIWKHSHAGKTPRPSHLKADGERFDIRKGLYLDGDWVKPGELPNCRCTWSPVIPGID